MCSAFKTFKLQGATPEASALLTHICSQDLQLAMLRSKLRPQALLAGDVGLRHLELGVALQHSCVHVVSGSILIVNVLQVELVAMQLRGAGLQLLKPGRGFGQLDGRQLQLFCLLLVCNALALRITPPDRMS
jgi:hypothetical protein